MTRVAVKNPSPATLRVRKHRAQKLAREIEFVRADWALFLHPDRLPQKAGCPRDRLRAMILKELVDNALDAGADVTLDQIDPDTWVVTDDGPGLDREQVRAPLRRQPADDQHQAGAPPDPGRHRQRPAGGHRRRPGERRQAQVESRGARYVLDVDRGTGETVVIEENGSDVDRRHAGDGGVRPRPAARRRRRLDGPARAALRRPCRQADALAPVLVRRGRLRRAGPRRRARHHRRRHRRADGRPAR